MYLNFLFIFFSQKTNFFFRHLSFTKIGSIFYELAFDVKTSKTYPRLKRFQGMPDSRTRIIGDPNEDRGYNTLPKKEFES